MGDPVSDFLSFAADPKPAPNPAPQPDYGGGPVGDFLRSAADPVGGYLRSQARDGAKFEDVRPVLEKAGMNPDAAEPTFRLEVERGKQSQEGESGLEYLGRRSGPVGSALGNVARDQRYKQAVDRYAAGNPQNEEPSEFERSILGKRTDAEVIARYERLQQIDKENQSTFGGQAGDALARIPAIAGEAYLTRGVPVGPLARLPFGAQAAKLGVQAQVMPSMTLESASRRSVEQGGELYDAKNLAPAAAMSALNNVVLGRLQSRAGVGDLPTRVIRGAAAAPLGVAEQQGVDLLGGAVDEVLPDAYKTRTRYGAIGDLARGEPDKAATHATVQALTFAAFAAMHGRSANPAETVGPALDSLAKKGLSKEAAAKAVNDAVAGTVEPPTEAVRQHVAVVEEATRPPGDLPGAVERNKALEDAHAAAKDGKPAVYVDMDVDNVAGLARVGGHDAARAHMRDLVEIVHDELAGTGADVKVFRHAADAMGDEHSAVVVGATKQQVDAALRVAGSKIAEFTKNQGTADIPHTKAGRPPGVGVTAFAEPIDPAKPWKTAVSEAEAGTETLKARRVREAPEADPRAEVNRLEGLRNVSDHRLADAASRMKDADERANLLGAPQAAKDARLAAQLELSKARKERKDLQRQLDTARDAVLRQPSPAKSSQPVAEPPVEGEKPSEPVQAPQETAPGGPQRAPKPGVVSGSAGGEIVATGASGGHADPGGLGNEIEAAIRAASGGEQSFHYRDLGDGGFVKVQGSHVTFGRKSDFDHVIVSFRPNGTAVVASKMYPQDRAAYAAAQERVADSLRKAGIPTNIDGKEPPAAGGEKPALSDQESHVLEQTRAGRSLREIAGDKELSGLSHETVRARLKKALEKSGLTPEDVEAELANQRAKSAVASAERGGPGTVIAADVKGNHGEVLRQSRVRRGDLERRQQALDDLGTRYLKEAEDAGPAGLSPERQAFYEAEAARLHQPPQGRPQPADQPPQGVRADAAPRPGGGPAVPAPGAAGGVPQAEPAGGAGRGGGAGDPDGAGQPLPGGPRNGRAASLANLKQNRTARRSIAQLRKDGGIDPDTFIANFGRGVYDAIVESGKPNPFEDAQGKKGRRHWEDVAADLAKDGTIKSDQWQGGEGEQTSPDANDFLELLRDNRPLAEDVGSAAGQREIERKYAEHARRQQAESDARGEKAADFSDEPIPFFRLPWQTKPKPPGPGGTPAPSAPGPSGVVDEVRTLLAPATRSEPAKTGGNVVRANNAILAHKKAVAEAALKAGADYFDDLVTKAGGDEAKLKANFLAFTDPIQSGAIAAMGPEMKGMAETVRRLYDERTAAVTSRKLIDGTKLIENYVTQLWADPKRPDATPEEIGRLLAGRRPLAGAEGFKKQRFYETYRDGIEAGLVPRDWNPVRTLLAGLHQIDKSVMAHDTVQELKENGLWEFTRLGGDRKPGWEHINDKIATVFAPPEAKVKEYFDKQQMEGLEKFADSIGLDVETARDSADVVRRGMAGGLPKPVGKRGGALGASVGDTVIRRFGTPEEVLAHEIGHQLDKKYDMARGLQAPGLAGEMEALAKLRASGRVSPEYAAYLQAPGERAANLVTAYLHAPELLRKEAPLSAEWFDALVASHPELHPIRDIKPSLELTERDQMMRLAGPVLTGHWTTPGEVATLLNNHLSPGLYGRSRIYEGVRHAANTLNGFQLGFSAFHAGFVTMDTQVSAVSLGLKQVSRGDFAAGLKTLAAGAVPGVAPVRSFLLGTKLGREYFAPGSQGAEIAGLVEMLEQAGGRAKMDTFHGGDRVEAFRKALRAVQLGNFGKLPHALLNAIPALAEAVQKPVMEVLVPRMKMGVFAEAARYELDRNPNMTREEFRDTLGKTWDSVENRLGQMTYDNLFWNRTFKDLLMVGVRSVGWNVGTVRELAGGLRDIPRAVRDVPTGRGVSDRLAYTAALPMVAALWGAMYGYLFGEPPTETKDYFFPKTGRRRKDGSADRVSLPSYMRDVAALTNRGDEGPVRVAANAWSMAKHKANPLLGTVAEMLENQDFYGKAIYNPADPSVEKARDLAAHVLKAFQPFAVRSYEQQGQQNAPLGQKLQGFVGITPAPSNVVHTAEEQRAAEAKRKVVLTPIGKLQQERKKAAGR